MIYELRTYIIVPGRMADIEKRFREVTLPLFQRHGMKVVGFWRTAEEGKPVDELVYLLAFPSLEARHRAWEAFRNDPDWLQAREESERNGALVARVGSKVLLPTAYSPLQ